MFGFFAQTFDLRNNHIGRLANDSFDIYPKVKRLLLAFNKVHTVEPESLASLDELEMLDLTQNAIKEVPPGLPKSLQKLYLGGNPVADVHHLDTATGLQVLGLRESDLSVYPALGLLPNVVEVDVSGNYEMTTLDPARLAVTCRLAKLNVTDNVKLFEAGRPGSHCQCQRFIQWAKTYRIEVLGLTVCPDPVPEDRGSGGDDDPDTANCSRAPDAALVAYKDCMHVWERRNTPYWAIASGLVLFVGMLMALCVCLRRRKRRQRHHGDKEQAADACCKDNNGTKAENDAGAAVTGNKNAAEPAALLSST